MNQNEKTISFTKTVTDLAERNSQAAILALSSNTPTDCLNTINAELKLRSSSHMTGLWSYSGFQVMVGSSAMKEPTKKPSREPSRLNRKSP
ncbi:hypothetical protein TNCV_2767141 [Trichonephila clavipes]|nr:hypothetical protein TNCV_2767141 [Trichonephila clavipes]